MSQMMMGMGPMGMGPMGGSGMMMRMGMLPPHLARNVENFFVMKQANRAERIDGARRREVRRMEAAHAEHMRELEKRSAESNGKVSAGSLWAEEVMGDITSYEKVIASALAQDSLTAKTKEAVEKNISTQTKMLNVGLFAASAMPLYHYFSGASQAKIEGREYHGDFGMAMMQFLGAQVALMMSDSYREMFKPSGDVRTEMLEAWSNSGHLGSQFAQKRLDKRLMDRERVANPVLGDGVDMHSAHSAATMRLAAVYMAHEMTAGTNSEAANIVATERFGAKDLETFKAFATGGVVQGRSAIISALNTSGIDSATRMQIIQGKMEPKEFDEFMDKQSDAWMRGRISEFMDLAESHAEAAGVSPAEVDAQFQTLVRGVMEMEDATAYSHDVETGARPRLRTIFRYTGKPDEWEPSGVTVDRSSNVSSVSTKNSVVDIVSEISSKSGSKDMVQDMSVVLGEAWCDMVHNVRSERQKAGELTSDESVAKEAYVRLTRLMHECDAEGGAKFSPKELRETEGAGVARLVETVHIHMDVNGSHDISESPARTATYLLYDITAEERGLGDASRDYRNFQGARMFGDGKTVDENAREKTHDAFYKGYDAEFARMRPLEGEKGAVAAVKTQEPVVLKTVKTSRTVTKDLIEKGSVEEYNMLQAEDPEVDDVEWGEIDPEYYLAEKNNISAADIIGGPSFGDRVEEANPVTNKDSVYETYGALYIGD